MYSLDWAYAYGAPEAEAFFRTKPEDFYVDEALGFELEGSGEHVFLRIEKTGDNTTWVAGQIARLAAVEKNSVGYAGLKDRHAVTRQWFSVYLPKGDEPDWSLLEGDSIKLLDVQRHTRKLRRGDHQLNHFVIRLRGVTGDKATLDTRLKYIATEGVPNYFGLQRFGIDGGNLQQAHDLLVNGKRIKNRQQRGMMLSAARSYLFNLVLSDRIGGGDWEALLPGDPSIEGQPSAPLWGRGRSLSSDECLLREQQTLADWSAWCDGLEHVGLNQERRALKLKPVELQHQWLGDDLVLGFALPPGTFATAVLREACQLKTVPDQQDMV